MTLKRQYFEKMEWGIIHWPWKNNLQIFIFHLSLKKNSSLRIWRIRQTAKKVLKFRKSRLLIEQHEKTLDYLVLS
jgi:hypothetical protein